MKNENNKIAEELRLIAFELNEKIKDAEMAGLRVDLSTSNSVMNEMLPPLQLLIYEKIEY